MISMKETEYYKSGRQQISICNAGKIGSKVSAKNAEKIREAYALSPKKCSQCSEALNFYKRTYKFCSSSCAATYNNINKKHGSRRSKLEIFLEEQIRSYYPNLQLLCNDKETINSELDFYFPELKLAIELNGILHFEPIYGHKKLEQIQNNDSKKYFLCCQKQINLAIIDSSTCKYLNQSAKSKYWSIINSVIQKQLNIGE
jgi:hypothetical protein